MGQVADVQLSQISCGEHHFAGVEQAEGRLFTWGGNSALYNRGQCGHGDTKGCDQPKQVLKLEGHHITKVVCGGYHTLVLNAANELYAFGSNQYGECGAGDTQNILNPV